jgi:DIL domain
MRGSCHTSACLITMRVVDSIALASNASRLRARAMQQCIHAPRTSHRVRAAPLPPASSASGAEAKASPWATLLAALDALRAELAANHVPPFLQRKLFVQLFSFINVQLFNQLLLRRECCSFPNGEYVKNGLAQARLVLHLSFQLQLTIFTLCCLFSEQRVRQERTRLGALLDLRLATFELCCVAHCHMVRSLRNHMP